jgi:hypothetical protein
MPCGPGQDVLRLSDVLQRLFLPYTVASIVNADRARLWAVGERPQEIGQLRVSMPAISFTTLSSHAGRAVRIRSTASAHEVGQDHRAGAGIADRSLPANLRHARHEGRPGHSPGVGNIMGTP